MIRGLYLITGAEPDDEELLRRVRSALRGGVRIVQYRDKQRPAPARAVLAERLCALCREAGALFLINDRPELALATGADGVHLGQADMPLDQARDILGPDRLIGISTRTPAQAREAQQRGADYIGLGSMFPTASKEDAVHVGVQTLREVRAAVDLPIVAIGGITPANAGEVIDAGADAVAVISAVMNDPDPDLAARELVLQFNRRLPWPRGRVLTIAGSDSGGGAGIQADLKTITLLGSFAMSALTALTAQNTLGVRGIHAVPVGFVRDQIEAVLEDIGTDTVKTGMLFSAEIVAEVAAHLARHGLLAVVDPVMIAKGGAPLLENEAVAAVCEKLLPRTYLVTPNIPEAEAMCGQPVREAKEMEQAARHLQQLGARNVLIKGGHLAGEALDLLLAGNEVHVLSSPRIETPHTHGTGCTYAAAIAAFLAQGIPLVAAVKEAKDFINAAIAAAVPLGRGHGPVNHFAAVRARGGPFPKTL